MNRSLEDIAKNTKNFNLEKRSMRNNSYPLKTVYNTPFRKKVKNLLSLAEEDNVVYGIRYLACKEVITLMSEAEDNYTGFTLYDYANGLVE